MAFNNNCDRKHLFLSACFCWGSGLSLREMRWTKNLNLVDSLVTETLAWTLHFVTRKYLDYMQYYMTLLEQCEHIVVKDLAIVI